MTQGGWASSPPSSSHLTCGPVLQITTTHTEKPLLPLNWLRGKIQSQGDLKPRSPRGTQLRKLPVGPWSGTQGRHEDNCSNSGFTPLLLKTEFGPALGEGVKNMYWIYLPLEWTRQISILKGIAFKSSVDFENNIIAWYHKQFPIFRSSWARLSFTLNSTNSITAAREMELQWTGIHFP